MYVFSSQGRQRRLQFVHKRSVTKKQQFQKYHSQIRIGRSRRRRHTGNIFILFYATLLLHCLRFYFHHLLFKSILQVVLQTMGMRRDTLNNHRIVAEEIERRVRMLSNAKDRQLSEMQRLEGARQKLQNDVENKAEKLDEINNKQEDLTRR